jgi:hypothetical protein
MTMNMYVKKSKFIGLGLLIILAVALVLLSVHSLQKTDSINTAQKNVSVITAKQELTNEPTLNYVISQAKSIGYQSFDEMNADSDIVIQGIKTGVVKNILQKNEDGQVTDQRTLSSLSVDKLFRDGSGKIKKGSNIIVQENAAVEGNTIYSIEGYQLMNTNEEYLLFLRASLTEPDVYIIKGVYYGKVPLNPVNDFQFQGSNKSKETLREIFKAARKAFT